MMHTTHWATLGLLFVAFASACGGSDTSSSPAVDTGLPPDKPLDELTDSEVQQACQSLADALSAEVTDAKLTRFTCTLYAAAISQTASTCKSQLNDCLANPPSSLPNVTAPTVDCSSASSSNLTGCTATVSEFEQCANDTIDALRAYEAQFTCNLAGDTQALQDLASGGIDQPQSCTTLNSECPGVM